MDILQFNAPMRIWELQRAIVQALSPRYGQVEAKAMVSLIFHHLKGWDSTALVINSDTEASQYLVEKIDEILGRLMHGEPLQYILGEARFYGMDLKVDRSVLIPRQETEELVDMIVKANEANDLRVLDVGTGSGAIAIALSRNLKFPEVEAIDISESALEIARENARLKHAKIDFKCEDIFKFEPEPESYDIIVSNPPYVAESERKDMDVNVLDYEPELALFVPDSNPLLYYSRIAEVASIGLRSGGKLYFEINPLFAKELRAMLQQLSFSDVDIIKDISGRDRFASAIKR